MRRETNRVLSILLGSGIFEETTSSMHCILKVVSKFNDLGLMYAFD
jgi:hypothetical protein